MGLSVTKKTLSEEAHLSFDEYQICDNVDLDNIYLEYCSYYQLKFGKKPKFVKKNDVSSLINLSRHQPSPIPSSTGQLSNARASANTKRAQPKSDKELRSNSLESTLSVVGFSSFQNSTENNIENKSSSFMFKPIHFDKHPGEWHDMVELICRDIIHQDLGVKWEQICGAEIAKMILTESVIMPIEYPHLFTGNVKPWRAVL